jgi:hypothetical protein
MGAVSPDFAGWSGYPFDSGLLDQSRDRRNVPAADMPSLPNVVIPSKENRLEAAFHTKAQAIRSTIRNSALWRVQQMFFWEKLG